MRSANLFPPHFSSYDCFFCCLLLVVVESYRIEWTPTLTLIRMENAMTKNLFSGNINASVIWFIFIYAVVFRSRNGVYCLDVASNSDLLTPLLSPCQVSTQCLVCFAFFSSVCCNTISQVFAIILIGDCCRNVKHIWGNQNRHNTALNYIHFQFQ